MSKELVDAINELKQANLRIWSDHESSARRIFYAIVGFGALITFLLFIGLAR